MSGNITRETDASVQAFLEAVEHAGRRQDAVALRDLMQRVTGKDARMWGPSIVGFGRYHYRYESGREGDMLRIGFSPRKANLAIYLVAKGEDHAGQLARLGKHRIGASCLYINRLADVDLGVLESLVAGSWERARLAYGEAE